MRYDINNAPLLAYTRGGHLEGLHRGSFVVANSLGKIIARAGETDQLALLRSCAKPFQLISVLKSGAVEKFGFTDSELAVAAASHSGEKEHVQTVHTMMKKMNLPVSLLRCGSHPALFPHVSEEMIREDAKPEPVRNNCSGKHASMLAVCEVNSWSKENYESINHHLQISNRKITADFAGKNPEEVGYGIDGCTVPTFSLRLLEAAMTYARIAEPAMAPEGYEEYASKVFKVMNGYPSQGSGKIGRLEAKLMELFPGQMIAKVGAEAFFAIGIAPGLLDKHGVGIALKLEDGINFNRAVDPIIVSLLEKLGILNQDKLSKLEAFYPQIINNCRGEKVGDVRVLFDI